MVYMGSTVVYGRGSAVITATGMDTEMGKIAGALAEAQEGQTPLQRKLSQLSKVLTWLVLGICLVIFGVQLLRAGSFSAGVVVDSFMVAVSLAVAAIPEGLAAVGDGGAVHRRYQYVQAERHHSPAYGGGNPGLRPDHLL
ncbi:MAG: hypothetical protein ACLSHU_10340 [Oscillospiraceae bacterium]